MQLHLLQKTDLMVCRSQSVRYTLGEGCGALSEKACTKCFWHCRLESALEQFNSAPWVKQPSQSKWLKLHSNNHDLQTTPGTQARACPLLPGGLTNSFIWGFLKCGFPQRWGDPAKVTFLTWYRVRFPLKVYPNPKLKSFSPRSRASWAESGWREVDWMKRTAFPNPSQLMSPKQSPPVMKKRGHEEGWYVLMGWLSR